jgi:hypothetical protein
MGINFGERWRVEIIFVPTDLVSKASFGLPCIVKFLLLEVQA